MANNIFLGTATAATMAKTATPGGTIESGDKFIMVVDDTNGNSETLSVTCTGTTATQVCTDIDGAITALASTSLFKSLVTVTNNTTFLTFTANTTGVPFGLTLSTTENDDSPADAQTFSAANTVSRSGPKDYGVAANWSLAAVPVANDIVFIDPTAGDILYGLAQSTVEIDGFYRPLAHQGHIGDNTNYLYIDVEDTKPVEIDYHFGPTISAPSRRTMIRTAGAPITTVHNVPTSCGVSAENGKPPTRLLFGSASASLYVVGGTGTVGIAKNKAGESSTIGTVNVTSSSASVVVGLGVTITTVRQTAGDVTIESAITNIYQYGGTLSKWGSGAIDTLLTYGGTSTVNGSGAITSTATTLGGTLYLNTTGTVAQARAFGGTLSHLQSSAARTDGAAVLEPGSLFYTDNSYMTLTGGIVPSGIVELEAVAAA